MDVEERAHNESLLQIYTAHLRQLEIMAAKYGGLAIPSHITLEIEENRRKIAEIEARLRSATTTRPASPRHNLPPRDYERFVGRQKELAEVHRLLSSRSRAFVITIDGIGGIGKSALALETAYYFVDQYPELPEEERFEAIVWVSAKRTYLTAGGIRGRRQVFRTLEDVFATIARVFDYQAITRARLEEQREIVEQVLREQRTLLILDNLETVDDDDLLDFLHELPEPTKALVTTRHRIDVARTVRLTGMRHDDALALIDQEARRKDATLSIEEREALWQRTGGVPLAIVWSIGLMGLGSSVESVLRRLGSGQSDIARFCFEESMAQIHGRDAHKLLLALSLFVSDASREALGVVAGLGEDEFGRDMGLEELLRLSLINKEGDRFSLLPLTRNFMQDEAGQYGEWMKHARERLKQYFYVLIETHGGLSQDWQRQARVERNLANILAVVDDVVASLKYQSLEEGSPTSLDPSSLPEAQALADVIVPLSRTCRIRGYWNECERLSRLMVNIESLIGNMSRVAWSNYDLCRISFQRGDLSAARKYGQEAYNVWQRAKRPKRQAQAERLIGLVELQSGNIDEGAVILRHAMDSYIQSGGVGDLHAYLESMGYLCELQNDNAGARDYYLQAINLSKPRNDTPNLAYEILCLGRVTAATGNAIEAKEHYHESLELARECGRADVIAEASYRLAILEAAQQQVDTAKMLSQRALDLFRRLGMKREQTEAEALLARLAEGPQSS